METLQSSINQTKKNNQNAYLKNTIAKETKKLFGEIQDCTMPIFEVEDIDEEKDLDEDNDFDEDNDIDEDEDKDIDDDEDRYIDDDEDKYIDV